VEVLFGVEFQTLSGWRVDEEALLRTRVPVLMLAGADSPPFFREAANWFAQRLGGTVEQVRGGHGVPFDHPVDIASRVARFVEDVRA
jgi:pimeloyl-ACP methyl ester carboxylesterase